MKREELLKAIAETEQFMNRVTMEIGQEYAQYYINKNENLVASINANVEVFQQLEIRVQDLRKELRNLGV